MHFFDVFSNTANQTTGEANKRLNNAYIPQRKYAFNRRDNVEHKESQICLSIIIPVFNGECYLRECIESILLQETNFEYELICINDGSTDSSLNILNEYSNNPVVKIITQKNGGISAARNRGIYEAKGQFLLFVDNDDVIAPMFINKMVQSAYDNQADIVKCGHQIIQNGQLGHKYLENKSCTFSGKEIDHIYRFNGFCWGTLFRRELFDKISFPEGYWYEDMVTRLLLYPQCKVFSYVGETLYYYRMHSGNASGTVWNRSMNKALDQYYLPRQFFDESLSDNYRFGTGLCFAYQYEIGVLLFSRTLDLENEVREAAFVLACDLNDRLVEQCPDYITCGKLSERLLNKAFIARDYIQWKRICKYSMYLY